MNVLEFNRAVASNLISMYRMERALQQQRQEKAADETHSRDLQLAEIERENQRAIRMAQSAIASSSLDLLA